VPAEVSRRWPASAVTGPAAGRRPTRLAVLVAVASVWLVPLAGLFAAPVSAAEPCVGVLVDARLLGGVVSTGCAEGDPASGLDALAAAGFSYAFAPRLPGFVCQIDAAPECRRTGTTTYWSYWYRPKGSRTWVYSSAGAGSRDPAPGSTEAWVWQDGGRREPPDVALETICPRVAKTRTGRAAPPSSSPSPEPSRARASANAGAASHRTTGQASASPASSPPATAARASTPVTTAPPEPPASTTSSGVSSAAGGVPAGDGPDRSPWTGVVLGGGLVAALGAAAVARSRRSGGRP